MFTDLNYSCITRLQISCLLYDLGHTINMRFLIVMAEELSPANVEFQMSS